MEKFKVTFYPDNKTIEVEKDKTILSAAISAGFILIPVCGGDGVCGRCKVILKKGQVSYSAHRKDKPRREKAKEFILPVYDNTERFRNRDSCLNQG